METATTDNAFKALRCVRFGGVSRLRFSDGKSNKSVMCRSFVFETASVTSSFLAMHFTVLPFLYLGITFKMRGSIICILVRCLASQLSVCLHIIQIIVFKNAINAGVCS